MKILVIPDRLEIRGGLETHVTSLCKEWSKKSLGNEILVYSNAISKEFQKELAGSHIISGWSENNNKYIIDNFKPEIIIAHPFSGIDLGYRLALKLKDVKLFATMHGNYTTGLNTSFLDKIEKVFCVSNTAYNAISGIVPEDKLKLIYNGISTKDFYPTKKPNGLMSKLKLLQKNKTISIITRLSDGKEKPVRQVLEIVGDLANRLQGLNLIIVGGGNYYEEIKTKCDNLRKSPNLRVACVGEVANVRSYINLADLVLGCDRVAIESILCNKKVFYMGLPRWKGLVKIDNYKELIFSTDGFVDYSNDELFSHLTWMLTQEESINPYTNELYNELLKLCDLTVVSNQYLNIFKSSLDNKKKELS